MITGLDVGGAEQMLAHIATGLTSRGHAARVFSLLPPPDRSGVVDQIQHAGIAITFGNATSLRHAHRLQKALRRWLNETPADLTQSFMFHANVMTGLVIDDAHRMIAGLRVADPSRLRRWIERRYLRRCDGLTCVSSAVASFATERLDVPTSKCHVITNGVDVVRFQNAKPLDWTQFGLPRHKDVTLYVGRLHPQKNLDLLWQHIDQIAPADGNRMLVLIGDGPQRAQWLSRRNQIGPDRVAVLPWMPDVACAYQGAKVLVLASHFEGMANVVLEAMASGRPVVCSDVEGCRDLVGHDPNQYFAAGDGHAMVDRLNAFWCDANLATQTGRENQKHVASKFSITKMVDGYEQLYINLGSVRK
ncbi:MAG: glycosyltransferase family 4 protein [Planctomycetota bacterium]